MTQRSNQTAKLDSGRRAVVAGTRESRTSVSEFVLDTAPSEAEEQLPDRRVFVLEAKS